MNERFFKTEDGNHVRFEWKAVVKNERASLAEGRPIYDKSLFAVVSCPNNPHSEVTHELERHIFGGAVRTFDDKVQRFARELQAFRSGDSAPELEGMPIEHWAALDVSQVASLKAMGVHTVDQIAALNDTGMQHFGMGARDLQKRAAAFLEASKGDAPIQKLAAENEQLKDKVAELEEQIRELAAAGKIDGRTKAARALREAAA